MKTTMNLLITLNDHWALIPPEHLFHFWHRSSLCHPEDFLSLILQHLAFQFLPATLITLLGVFPFLILCKPELLVARGNGVN